MRDTNRWGRGNPKTSRMMTTFTHFPWRIVNWIWDFFSQQWVLSHVHSNGNTHPNQNSSDGSDWPSTVDEFGRVEFAVPGYGTC
jgi:hypothetical protein